MRPTAPPSLLGEQVTTGQSCPSQTSLWLQGAEGLQREGWGPRKWDGVQRMVKPKEANKVSQGNYVCFCKIF